MSEVTQDDLREALKRSAVTLKEGGVPFALGGGYASWARGGPEPDHDVDFIVAEDQVAQAEAVLAGGGLRVEHPAEDWLFKAFLDEAMVDIIFRLSGETVTQSLIDRSDELEVLSVRMPVLTATDLMVSKLKAFTEQQCDFGGVLLLARALREQVKWAEVQDAVAGNHFADTFLILLARLEIAAT